MPRAGRLLVENVKEVAVVTITDGTVIDQQHIDNIREELLDLLVSMREIIMMDHMVRFHILRCR